MQTQAEFWSAEGSGVWRTARKAHTCDAVNIDGPGSRCENAIAPGELYLDTGEQSGLGGGFTTYRYCASCADKPA
jgi:hypothetical protein